MATSHNPKGFSQDPTQSRVGGGNEEAGRRGRLRQVRNLFNRSSTQDRGSSSAISPTPFPSELSPATPSGYDPTDSTKLVNRNGDRVGAGEEITYGGGGPASFDATPPSNPVAPGAVSGLRPVPPARIGVKAYAPTPHPAGGENVSINLDNPQSPKPLTESTNPLTGGPSPAPTGSDKVIAASTPTPDINHSRALGYSTRGSSIPKSTDAQPPTADNTSSQSFPGGIGAFKQPFSNPTSAAIFHGFTKKLFSGNNQSNSTPGAGVLTRAAPASTAGQEDEDEGRPGLAA